MAAGIFDNEASAVDLKVYDALKDLYWKLNDTLLYQPKYDLTPEEQGECVRKQIHQTGFCASGPSRRAIGCDRKQTGRPKESAA